MPLSSDNFASTVRLRRPASSGWLGVGAGSHSVGPLWLAPDRWLSALHQPLHRRSCKFKAGRLHVGLRIPMIAAGQSD